MRVCLINDHYYRGSGAAIAIRRIAEAASADVEYWFAGCGSEANLEDLSWIPAGRYQRFSLKNSNPFRVIRELIRLKKWLKSNECELVHCHHRRVAVLLQLVGIPVLYTGQLAFPWAAWFRLLRPRFTTAITPSVATNLLETTGRKPIACIGNPASFPGSIPEIDIERVKSKAVCIGRLEAIKGHTHLLSAWKILHDRGYRYKLDIVGEGSLRANLEAQAKREGIEDSVRFCGFTKDISPFVTDSLFAILASEVEGQGIVTLEAASLGRASVLTAVAGSIDLLPPNRKLPNGVPYGTPDALADVIEQWFLDPEEVVREGERFFSFLKTSSDSYAIAQGYRKAYKQVLAQLAVTAR